MTGTAPSTSPPPMAAAPRQLWQALARAWWNWEAGSIATHCCDADNGIYAIDTQTAAISLLAVVSDYSRIVGLIHIPTNVNCNTQCAG